MANVKDLICYLPNFQNSKNIICRKKFKNSTGLASHQLKSHGRKQSWEEESLEFSEENKRPFNCKLCEKTFIHKYDAKCHVEKVHEIKNLNKNPYSIDPFQSDSQFLTVGLNEDDQLVVAQD